MSENRVEHPDPYLCCGHLAGHDGPCEPSVTRTVRPDVLDRLMELWELPWSEERYGEAQMLLGRIRVQPRYCIRHLKGCPPHGHIAGPTGAA